MAQKERNTDKRIDRVLNLVKAKFGFKNKSKAIAFLVRTYEQDFLEPELRPEFIEKMRKIQKQKTIKMKYVYLFLIMPHQPFKNINFTPSIGSCYIPNPQRIIQT